MKERLQATLKTVNKDIRIALSNGCSEDSEVIREYRMKAAALKQAIKRLTCFD